MSSKNKTAILLVGYQKDYFAEKGLLRPVLEDFISSNPVIDNTVALLESISHSIPIISTPLHFTSNYQELVEPVGILKIIKEIGALQANTEGSKTISELIPFKNRIIEVCGKRGFNAFAYTSLDQVLKSHHIDHLVLAGAITSICIDSTGRYAHEKGYKVTILSDCTAARTTFEQNFYCENIFPVYAEVNTSKHFIEGMQIAA